jgi:two-component system, NtrC family, nitrogen regulation sensor histidine kinase NtrY
MPERPRFTLYTRLALITSALALLSAGIALLLTRLLPEYPFQVLLLTIAFVVPLALYLAARFLRPLLIMFRAMGGTVLSYKDGDYSFGLNWERNDEMADLVDVHNELGTVLREQRLHLVQRELLLDTMVQNTPVAMLLIAEQDTIVFANLAARQLLNEGRRLEGFRLENLLNQVSSALREGLQRGGDGLFSVQRASETEHAEEDIYHLARRQFNLNGRRHELLLLRHLTAELRRQEVQTWKKVIRIISHELNNSLAPIASLAHSGKELLKRQQHDRLPEVLETIGDRARHLDSFIAGYAHFAKLPLPRKDVVQWPRFVAELQSQTDFRLAEPLPIEPAHFDTAQLTQAVLNLLKNAHESGSPPDAITLSVRRMADGMLIEVSDRGSGMTTAVMSNALVPFYSTKRSGTGLGLALAREIVEAHGGRITLGNREGGGLVVGLTLPH